MLEGSVLKEHTLNRLGHGLSQWHVDRYDQLGFDAYIDEQLRGSLEATASNGATLQSKLDRSILARRQLEAALLDFWFNHFNVDATGGDLVGRTAQYHQDVIHQNVLGRFGDMLLATAKSPAMLSYLDNRINFRPQFLNGNTLGPNENYGRELLELHTMGVSGGYTETDVVEVARVLTGWSTQGDVYEFKTNRHDRGRKVVLGATFAAGRGEDEGVELLSMLAAHSATASFISQKLCRRLVSENPSSDVVNAAAQAFDISDGDLQQTVRAILTSPGFRSSAAFRSKVKPPLRYLASAVMAMGATTQSHFSEIAEDLATGVLDLGEDPYRVAPPTGYPEASAYWVSSSSMQGRFRLAGLIAKHSSLLTRLRSISGANGNGIDQTVDDVAARLCPGGISGSTRSAAIGFVRGNGSSANQRISNAAHAILASPEFVRF